MAIPQQWLRFVQSARDDRDITLAIADELDHRLVKVDICLPKDTECVYHRPAKATSLPSRLMLQLPAKQALVQKCWQEAPSPMPGWTIDFHAAILTKLLRLSANWVCPPTKKAPRMPFVTQELYDALKVHAKNRKHLF